MEMRKRVLTLCAAAMEDSHVTLLNLDEDSANPNTFFAVYDGHGGMHAICYYLSSTLLLTPLCFRFCHSEIRRTACP